MGLLALAYSAQAILQAVDAPWSSADAQTCDKVQTGFQCQPLTSHYWGEYSPFFSIPSEIDPSLPEGCDITFVQILSRHGARYPTLNKTISYNQTIAHIQKSVTEYGKGYEFIADYNYTLGSEQLTAFGQQEMINSGIKFYGRYEALTRGNIPFIRASGEERVVESARNWTQGYHKSRVNDKDSPGTDNFPYNILIIPEGDDVKNPLDNRLCASYENGTDSEIGKHAQHKWRKRFISRILEKLNKNLPGANLEPKDAVSLMDLCPFDTVANVDGKLSPFCGLFCDDEWRDYDYYGTLGKYYGHGDGNPLGPTQGVGFTNELIARLTGKPVQDHTSTNSTLDSNPSTFPLNIPLYADFSHDDDMVTMFSAMGLYNATAPLSKKTRESAIQAKGFSASWVVPFSARMYVEKMTCGGVGDELVRILVNDRVIPLHNCDADRLGRCTVGSFVKSLSFARNGGDWDQCSQNDGSSD